MVRQDNVQVNLKIDGSQARTELDNLQRKADLLNTELKGMKKGSEEYAATSQKLKAVSTELDAQRQKLGTAGMSLQQLQRHAGSLARELRSLTPGTQSFIDKSKEFQQVQKRIGEVNNEIKGIGEAVKPKGMLQNAISSIGPAMLAAFSVQALVGFGRAILDTRAEFQKLEAVLANTLGSKSVALQAMSMIKDIAASTPFSVQELTASFVKLANQGIRPTRDEIVQLGDLAASQGKQFDQLADAIVDAQTGEFERLKEFGIRASKEGDKVRFSFKGVETQVNFAGDAINQYITGLGKLEGVQGNMAAQSATLGGQISNLGDAWDNLLNTLGGRTEGIFSSVIGWMAQYVNWVQRGLSALRSDAEVEQEFALQKGAEFMERFRAMTTEQRDKLKDETRANLEAVNEVLRTGMSRTMDGGTEALTERTRKQFEFEQKLYQARLDGIGDYYTQKHDAGRRADAEEEKRRAEAAEKERKEQQKRTAEYLRAEADAQRRLQDMYLASIQNEEAREVAQAAVRARREAEQVQAGRAGAETKAALVVAIEEQLQGDVAKIQQKYADQRRKSDEQFAAEYDDRRRRSLQAEADLMLVQAQLVADQLESRRRRNPLFGPSRADIEAASQLVLEAQIERLETQKRLELENLELTADERLLVEADYEARKDELRRQYIDGQAEYEKQKRQEIQDAAVTLAQTGLQAIADFAAIAAQRELGLAEAVKNERIGKLKFELNAKRLSQEEYQAAAEVVERQAEERARQVRRRQAETEKKVALAQAVMQGALAVLKASPNPVLMALAGVVAAVQVAKIAATPVQFARGGIAGAGAINPVAGVPQAGQLHAHGGIRMVDGATGQHLGEWERGEPYMILSRNTYANNKDVIDSLLHSSLYRNGAPIVSRRYEDGGVAGAAPPAPGVATGGGADPAADLTAAMLATLQDINEGVRRFPTLLKAYVSLTDLARAQDIRDEIDRESSFG